MNGIYLLIFIILGFLGCMLVSSHNRGKLHSAFIIIIGSAWLIVGLNIIATMIQLAISDLK